MAQETKLQEIAIEAREFRDRFETLLMSTSNYYGLPEASYAGYIEDEGDYYVYVSELAKHTKTLREMSDFHLFRLRPLSGSFVSGFAKAYTLTGENLLNVKHRNNGGHRKQQEVQNHVL